MSSQSTTERAAEIRKAYKANGWTSKQISVRSEYYSMGSSIHVVIKDATIALEPVKVIAESHEDIRRDEGTGEILCGGNRYVHVGYSSEALDARAATWLPAVEKAIAELNAHESANVLIPVEGTKYLVGRDQFGRPSLWSDSHIATCYDAREVARAIAVRKPECTGPCVAALMPGELCTDCGTVAQDVEELES